MKREEEEEKEKKNENASHDRQRHGCLLNYWLDLLASRISLRGMK